MYLHALTHTQTETHARARRMGRPLRLFFLPLPSAFEFLLPLPPSLSLALSLPLVCLASLVSSPPRFFTYRTSRYPSALRVLTPLLPLAYARLDRERARNGASSLARARAHIRIRGPIRPVGLPNLRWQVPAE